MDSIVIGPFAMPLGPLLLLLAVTLGSYLGKWYGRRLGMDVEPPLWTMLVVGVVAARLVFVAAYWDSYQATPWRILDIRDGGFTTVAGVAAASLAGVWLLWRRRSERQPLGMAFLTAGIIWGLGSVLAAQPFSDKATLPTIVLHDLQGQPVALESLRGQPVVINLWASWCGPCRREMPVLRDAQARYPDVRFVFANQGESAATVRAYLAAEGLALRHILLDPNLELGKNVGSGALPTTLFYDAQGQLQDRRMGELSDASLAQRLRPLQAGN